MISHCRLWVPGPDGSFFGDLQYLHGFVQLQDLIDKAVIRVVEGRLGVGSEKERLLEEDVSLSEVGVYTQQQPYPCFKRDK